jgi:hypothetical protein
VICDEKSIPNKTRGDLYSIQHYVIKFVRWLRKVSLKDKDELKSPRKVISLKDKDEPKSPRKVSLKHLGSSLSFRLITFLGLLSSSLSFRLTFLGLLGSSLSFRLTFLGLLSSSLSFRLTFLGLFGSSLSFRALKDCVLRLDSDFVSFLR